MCEETKFNTNNDLWKVDAEVDGIREEAMVHLFFTVLHFQCPGATGRDPWLISVSVARLHEYQ